MPGCRGPVTGSSESRNPNSATRIVPLSDTATAQSGELLKAGPVLLVIDHRAMRSALLKIAATELDNATLSCIAQRQCTPLLRCRRIAQLCPGATTALLESFCAWSKLIDERTLAASRSELV
jgi:hypothetical protein